jgi:hypothetical protein
VLTSLHAQLNVRIVQDQPVTVHFSSWPLLIAEATKHALGWECLTKLQKHLTAVCANLTYSTAQQNTFNVSHSCLHICSAAGPTF